MHSPPILAGFVFERVLSEDPRTRSASLLGHFDTLSGDRQAGVLILEKTHFSPSFYENVGQVNEERSMQHCTSLGSNDVYNWLLGWMPAKPWIKGVGEDQDAHVKLTLIRPATEVHIAKYSEQRKVMVKESGEVYATIVKPWIHAQPLERIQWVYNILDKKKEEDTILYEQTGEQGFIIVPDLKWDRKTLSSLYLVAIVQDRSLRSMRDLKKQHIPLLDSIRREGEQLAKERFGLADEGGLGKLRCFIHYQPTYYHFHVHLLSADFTSHPGASVGQAHLLDDVIELLESGLDFEKRTLTYSLGEQSQLLGQIRKISETESKD